MLSLLLAVLLSWLLAARVPSASAQATRIKYQSGEGYLIVEFLDDDLVHLELSALGPGPGVEDPIPTTPMAYKTDYPGPSSLTDDGSGTLETPELRVQVDTESLCVTLTDLARDPDLVLTTLCPHNLDQARSAISLTPESYTHAYGLGQEFITPSSSDGDWVGRVRSPGDEMGNDIVNWNGGAVGNTQFPVLYVVGEGLDSYALFADNQYRQRWDLTGDPWTVEMGGDWLRFYVMTGPDLQDLRADYMELVGRPPVPPKKMFGLWVSEYGFDNWGELEDKLRTLRDNDFPIDGFVLDLQWFGGIDYGSDDSPMGSLTWDRTAFPNPEAKIAELRESQGIGLVLIEHAYVSENLRAHAKMELRGYLARECEECPATYLETSPHWGKGGMIDWSNLDGGIYWHNLKREPLVDAGVIGHWTDLGEPQMYNSWAWYVGMPGDHRPLHRHADVHNLYNLLWAQSIYRGYAHNGQAQRPFILSRSGAPGIQRYGASMWSADIGANLSSLATHMNAQMHMSMSGMDYYGSDIGGFYRDALDGDLDEMYTQWFAYGMAFDVPARSHTKNLCNCRETAPDRIGDLQSNLQNVRQRYALVPYLYSLAHRAYLYGEPVFPPLVYYYQDDDNVREMGHQKLLGRDLLVAAVAARGETQRRVYLPVGEWINYRTLQRYHSSGQWYGPFAEYPGGVFTLPMFARAGAIIPQMHVDEATMNVLGKRSDGSRRDELIVAVYADQTPSSFTLYEDDGQTVAYRNGAVRTTLLSQVQATGGVTVTVEGAEGTYAGALASRDNVIKLAVDGARLVTGAAMNGVALPHYDSQVAFDAAFRGWYRAGGGLVVAKSGEMDVLLDKQFVFQLGTTYRWSSDLVSADVGRWHAVELDDRGKPHVVYQCETGVCYTVIDGAQRVTETIPNLSGGDVSLALDSAGHPHVSVGNGGLEYAYSDGTSWSVEAIEQDLGGTSARHSALALDAREQPHITYYGSGQTPTDFRHAYLDGSRWVTESVSGDARPQDQLAGGSSGLVIDAAGNLHALYDSERGDVVYARLDETGWMTQTIAPGHSGSLALGPGGRLHVSFISGYDLRYATLEGSGWIVQDIAPIAVIDSGSSPTGLEGRGATTIQVDSLGMPQVVFHYGLAEDATLFYARDGGSGWTTEAIDSSQVVGLGPLSLALDPSGYPSIAHYKAWPESELRYAHVERPRAILQPGVAASLVYTGSGSLRTIVQAPSGAVTQAVEIVLTERDYVATHPLGYASAGQGFQLEVYGSDGIHLPGHVFLEPLTITVEYAEQDLAALSDQTPLSLWYWDGGAWDAAGITLIEHDTENRRLVVTATQGSRFALFGKVHPIYLPLVWRNGGG